MAEGEVSDAAEIAGKLAEKKALDARWSEEFRRRAEFGGRVHPDFLAIEEELGTFNYYNKPWPMVEALLAEVARLKAALLEAADDVASWGAYASDYFQEKWDLPGDVARIKAAAAMKPSDAVRAGICPSCLGSGRVDRDVPVSGTYVCGTCLGSGKWPPQDAHGNEIPAGGE